MLNLNINLSFYIQIIGICVPLFIKIFHTRYYMITLQIHEIF